MMTLMMLMMMMLTMMRMLTMMQMRTTGVVVAVVVAVGIAIVVAVAEYIFSSLHGPTETWKRPVFAPLGSAGLEAAEGRLASPT